MALTQAYLTSTKNVPAIFAAIQEAGVPPKFSYEFLKSLGFNSSNDRAIVSVLRGLGFVDAAGVPTDRYRQYRDKTNSKAVFAEALREAYGDLFLANQKAQQLSQDRLKGFFASKSDKGDRVVELMGSTFRALAQLGDFAEGKPPKPAPKVADVSDDDTSRDEDGDVGRQQRLKNPEFHYNIQIHLPATRDIAVYNAIFRSLRENLD